MKPQKNESKDHTIEKIKKISKMAVPDFNTFVDTMSENVEQDSAANDDSQFVFEDKKQDFESENNQDDVRQDPEEYRIISQYPKKSLEIANKIKDGLHQVLLGKNFRYTFDEKDNDVDGLSFSFKSLSSIEDHSCKSIARENGWDRDMTQLSWEMFVFLKVRYSLISFCGQDMSDWNEEKKFAFIDKNIKAFVKTKMCEQYLIFEKALDLISRGKGEYDLVKKYSALLR